MRSRKVFVEKMQSWQGLNEADGSHNVVISIYNTHKPLARGYKVKSTDSWCAATVSAAAIACGYTDIIPTECSCGKMIELAQKKGIWVENDAYMPQMADIILYYWKDNGKGDCTGWPAHIGVVESVINNKITVIEGNIDNKVGRRDIKVNGKYIRGYICPKFDKEETPVQTKVEYYPKYTGASNSIVDALKSLGIASSLAERSKIAKANGIALFVGTSPQNSKLLSLLKAGKLIKSTTASTGAANTAASVKHYAKYTGKSNSLVDALKSLKIDSSYANRTKIAKANGVTLYVGTASQNTKLLNLLKQGKLVQY